MKTTMAARAAAIPTSASFIALTGLVQRRLPPRRTQHPIASERRWSKLCSQVARHQPDQRRRRTYHWRPLGAKQHYCIRQSYKGVGFSPAGVVES
jgi:hypothetical protein